MTSNLENHEHVDAPEDLTSLFRDIAHAEGFDAVGFVSPDAIPEAASRLNEFISAGRHGDMDWMETHQTRREAPLNLWSEVKTVIMLGMNYGPDTNPLDALEVKDKGVISVYARGHDYHDIIKKKLKKLARRLVEETGGAVKVFVDTAAVMYLLGTEMDYKTEELSSTFVFNNPNETERCGCGESFKVE